MHSNRKYFQNLVAFLKFKKTSVEREPDPYLRIYIKKAIIIYGELPGSSTDKEILQAFYENGINLIYAVKINIFLPIAFCRQLLPELKWEDDYYRCYRLDGKEVKMKFSQTSDYVVASEETSNYFSDHPNSDVILKIAGRSSEFHLINDVLKGGGKMEDIQWTPMQIIW